MAEKAKDSRNYGQAYLGSRLGKKHDAKCPRLLNAWEGQAWWPPPASWGTFTTVGQIGVFTAMADDYRHSSLNTNLLHHNPVGGLSGVPV